MIVSDATRNDTWHLLLDLEHQVRYYGALADDYSKRYRVLRFMLLLGVLIEGIGLYFLSGDAELLLGFGGAGAFFLGFLTVYDAVTNYPEVAASLRTASIQCDDLKTDAERLWRDIETYRITDQEAENRYAALKNSWARATNRLTLEVHDHNNVRAAEEAYQIITDRYAG